MFNNILFHNLTLGRALRKIERHLSYELIQPRLMALAVLGNLIACGVLLALLFGGPVAHWACG